MKISVYRRISRIVSASGTMLLVALLAGNAWSQQPQPGAAGTAQPDQLGREQVQAARGEARDKIQQARQETREARGDLREERRNNGRDDVREARVGARDAAQEGRESVREARRDLRAARREFRAERIRSGDIGLWLRRALGRLTVSDVERSGAIANSGLQEGDEIVSVAGRPVTTEREFIDALFANHESNQPVPVVVRRNGQEQTITLDPKPLIDEQVSDERKLQDFGIILDDSDPTHLKIQAIVPRSPAFYAGMRAGDRITGLRGKRVDAVADFVRGIIASAGGTTPVEVARGNQSRQLDLDVPAGALQEEPRTALRPDFDRQTAPPAEPQGQNFNHRNNNQGNLNQGNLNNRPSGPQPANRAPQLTPPR